MALHTPQFAVGNIKRQGKIAFGLIGPH